MEGESSDSVKVYYPKYSREKVIALVKAKIQELKNRIPLVKVILFGSYAKNRQTVASDIDILVLYSGEKVKDDYHIAWDILQIPEAQLHIYTVEEFERLKTSGSAFPKEIEKGIVLYP
ncbi:MAG: nucleotidyltransferase domain-containing protein [Nitrososphaeria archaeon]